MFSYCAQIVNAKFLVLSHTYIVSTVTSIMASILEKGNFHYKDYIFTLIFKFIIAHQLPCCFPPSVHPNLLLRESGIFYT